jgi:hypothetical protein
MAKLIQTLRHEQRQEGRRKKQGRFEPDLLVLLNSIALWLK